MKTVLLCLVFAVVGVLAAYSVNFRRYAQFEPRFGPIDYEGEVTAVNAMKIVSQSWSENFPKVELPDGNMHDFGVMSVGEKGEHVFVIKNTGNENLDLKVGASTCKCTVGELESESVPPGGQTEVTMSWTVKTNENTFGQSAELRTNDPTQVAIRFEIRGQVVRQAQLVPETITFGEVAAGEQIEVSGEIFTYFDENVQVGEVKFANDQINDLAEFEVTPFDPTEESGVHESATQGFRVRATIQPGLQQGPINQNLSVQLLDPDADDEMTAERTVFYPVSGRIVGVLSMLPSSKLKGVSGGGYRYDFGRLTPEDSTLAKAFVVLKGKNQASVKLTVGQVQPAEVVEAKLGEAMTRGKMTLYPLEMTLKKQENQIDRLGMNREDYGSVMIQSDNPNVPALKVRLKFSLPAR